jgi:4-hydroxybenzoate polyprenyltransferase
LWLSALGKPDWIVVWVFVLGTVLMRSAGCVINDLRRPQFRPHVERTKERPLTAGKVTLEGSAGCSSPAFRWQLLLLVLPLGNTLGDLALGAGAISSPPAIPSPSVFSRFRRPIWALPSASASRWPTPHSSAACRLEAWWLLLANVFWAVAYDTEYAMVDREDDLKIGIKTSAITFGRFDVRR